MEIPIKGLPFYSPDFDADYPQVARDFKQAIADGIVVDEDRGVIIGATFVGSDVAELLHSATVAVVGEVPIGRLWHAVPSYPTLSEVWLRWLEAYGRESAFA